MIQDRAAVEVIDAESQHQSPCKGTLVWEECPRHVGVCCVCMCVGVLRACFREPGSQEVEGCRRWDVGLTSNTKS